MTRIQWLGHSCLLLDTHRYRILIDPYLTDNPKAAADPGELTPDYILISHGHEDHIGDAVAIAKRTGAKVVANYEIATWLRKTQGLTDVHGMQLGGGFNFPFGRVKMTLAFHGSALPDGSNGGNPCGFYITCKDGKRIYNAADTGLFSDMKLIGDDGIDLAFLPIGDNFTMGPDDALKAVGFLRPTRVVPIHFDTFEIIQQDALAWAERVRRETTTVPVVMQPGEWLDL